MIDQLKYRLREASDATDLRGRMASSILNFWGKALEVRRDFDPLAWIAKTMSSELILIAGCQRSGSTLLYMLLTSHPKVTGKDESENRGHSFPKGIELFRNHIHGRLTCFKLPTRTPDLKIIQDRFPLSKIVWITRNPFAVVSSMKSLFVEKSGKNWLQTFGIQELKRHAVLFPEISEIDIGKDDRVKLKPYLWEVFDNHKFDEVKLGAYIWKYKIMAYEKYKSSGLKTCLVNYEELVEDPQAAMLPVLEFIGSEWNERILHYETIHKGRRYAGKTRGDQPIDASRINPDLNLTKEETTIVKEITGMNLTR